MRRSDGPAVVALPGRGHDERVWGTFLSRLRQDFEVVVLEEAEALARYVDPVIMAISEAASAAVHAARDGHARALVLMAPTTTQALPEINLDLRPRLDEAFKLAEVVQAAASTDDREQRRTIMAEGMVQLYGQGIAPQNLTALRAMFHDHAERLLDPGWEQASRQLPYEDELAELSIPVLVVGAGGDPYAAAIAAAVAGRIPRSELALLDTPQILYPWLSRPEATAEVVIRFVSAL